jgi:hypothetical protein
VFFENEVAILFLLLSFERLAQTQVFATADNGPHEPLSAMANIKEDIKGLIFHTKQYNLLKIKSRVK